MNVSIKYDTIIIGSGIAGLNLARKLSQAGHKVFLAAKEAVTEGSSKYAQGGIAVCSPLNPEDKCESHLEDTLRAGCGLSDPDVVRKIVESAWPKILELAKLGVNFDKDFNIEGSHSYSRVMHVADATGRAILKPLLDRVSRNHLVSIAQGATCISLLKQSSSSHTVCTKLINANKQNIFEKVLGARFRDISGDEYEIYAEHIVLAAGGLGALYNETTNPGILTGNGIALAYDAGAEIRDIEFVQFHPTVFLDSKSGKRFLITEAIRGAGALLRNAHGELFAEKYHPDAELATRDVVSRAILDEMKSTGADFVYLDLRSIDPNILETKFPNVYKTCLAYGFDLKTDLLPVKPAAHYSVGGIKTDINGATNISGLYALGECASSGLHGANRLASNSLLECIVGSDLLADYILELEQRDLAAKSVKKKLLDKSLENDTKAECCSNLRPISAYELQEIRSIVSSSAGLERSEAGLLAGLERLSRLPESLEHTTAKLLLEAALARKESRGTHFRTDYPCEQRTTKSSLQVKSFDRVLNPMSVATDEEQTNNAENVSNITR